MLLLATTAAALVEIIGAIGWWRWSTLERDLRHDPPAAAEGLLTDPLLALPPLAVWLQDLAGEDLAELPLDRVLLGLLEIDKLQSRWLPVSPAGPLNRATAQLLISNLVGARQALEQALVRDPTSASLHRLQTLVLRWSGYPQESLEHLAQALAISPTGELPIELTPSDERWARFESLHRRLDLYPRQRVKVLLEIAALLRQEARHDEVAAILAPVSSEPTVLLQHAQWDIEDGRLSSDLTAIEEIAGRRRYPASMRVRAWSLLAQARDLRGDPVGSLAAADEAVHLGPSSPAPYLVLASIAERRGDDETALVHLRRAWGVAPTNTSVLLRFAAVAERCDKVADARLALRRASELNSSRADIGALLVAFQIRQASYLDATMLLSQLLDRFPTDPQLLRLAQQLRREVVD